VASRASLRKPAIVAQDGARGAEERLVVALREQPDRGLFAAGHAPGELGVGHLRVQRGYAGNLDHGEGLVGLPIG
jgi:hypothetical protein